MNILKAYVFFTLLLLPFAAVAGEVVVTSTLQRGSILSSADLKAPDIAEKERDKKVNSFVGMALVRTIYEGHAINTRDVKHPNLVKRNTIVSMVYQLGALEIRTQGRALDAGIMGESIRVMNLNSRQTVQSIIVDNDIVKVN